MEQFSYAYIYALAAQAGFAFNKEPTPIDNIGIDVTIQDPERAYDCPPCKFTAQVKCVRKTKLNKTKNGDIYYEIKKKHYDVLTKSRPGNTITLLVLVVPEEPQDWIILGNQGMTLQHQLYWFCLGGKPLSKLGHKDSKEKIFLCSEALLTPESFPKLMQKIAEGEI